MGTRVNGTYHAAGVGTARPSSQTRLLIGVGAFVALLGALNVVLTNADMTRIEQSGPPRLALAGGSIDRFVPSLLAQLPRANAPASTVNAPSSADPRRSAAYIADKRALERWMALAGFGLSALFIGLEQTVPESRQANRSPIGTDLARLLVLLATAYAALSFFENG
ncbi:MAG TPA: hypothetical protein VGL99_34255 [Chloroflexota bacterium]